MHRYETGDNWLGSRVPEGESIADHGPVVSNADHFVLLHKDMCHSDLLSGI